MKIIRWVIVFFSMFEVRSYSATCPAIPADAQALIAACKMWFPNPDLRCGNSRLVYGFNSVGTFYVECQMLQCYGESRSWQAWYPQVLVSSSLALIPQCGSLLKASGGSVEGSGDHGAGPGLCPSNAPGSVINIDHQFLSEMIPIIGTDFSLQYVSGRMPGFTADLLIRVPVTTDTRPDVTSIAVQIKNEANIVVNSVTYSNASNITHSYVTTGQTWNGLGPLASLKYEVIVTESPASYLGAVTTNLNIGHFNAVAIGLGGWVPSHWLFYDSSASALYYGDGRLRKVSAQTISSGYRVAEEDGSVVYEFDSTGRIIRMRTGLRGTTVRTYSYSSGKLASITSYPGGRTTTFNYSSNLFYQIVTPYGKILNVTLDSNGYLQSVSDPSNTQVYSMSYSGGGLLASFQKPNGFLSTFTYEADGRLKRDSHSGGSYSDLILSSTNQSGKTQQLTTKLGRLTAVTHDEAGHLSSTTYPNGTILKSSFDSSGQTASITNRGISSRITMKMDPRFQAQVLYPYQTTTSLMNASGGVVVSRVDERTDSVTSLSSTDPFIYTSLVRETKLNSKKAISSFDRSSGVWTTATPLGQVSKVTIDAYERPVSVQKGQLAPVNLSYTDDHLTYLSQGDRVRGFDYDCTNGLLKASLDAEGHVTSYAYDSSERLTSVILPDLRTINYGYDSAGNLISITPPGRAVHSLTLGGHELLSEYGPPAVSGLMVTSSTYSYNDDRQLTGILRPDGQSISFSYGSSTGQLQSMTTPNGLFEYVYDSTTGSPNEVRGPVSFKTKFTYAGRTPVSQEEQDKVTSSSLWQYTVTLDTSTGRMTREALSAGSTSGSISYLYDDDERLKSAGSLTVNYRSGDGLMSSTALGSSTDFYSYNIYGEIAGYAGKYGTTELYQEILSRDKMSRVISVTQTIGGMQHSNVYQYDTSGRLTTVTRDSSLSASYVYDSNGNRTGGAVDGGTTSASYDAQDRMSSYGVFYYAYNANGELISKTNAMTSEITTYTYDVLGNLRQVVLPGSVGTVTYELDALNRRIGRRFNSVLTHRWIYDLQSRIVGELNSSGAMTRRYVYASKSNIPDYFIESGVSYRIFSDHLGSPRVIVRLSDGVIIFTQDHDEFGRIRSGGYVASGFKIPFGFAGGIYDPDTGLVRFGARDYDPYTGRWTSKDPIRFSGGDTNLYGYVANDPVNLIDPSGNCPWCIGAVVGGVASGVSAYLAGGDARTVAISAAVGAVAGAASMGVSAFTSSATAAIAANAGIGIAANVATQVATGTAPGSLNYTQVGIGALAGGIGAGVGLGAGTAAFYGTPVIGRGIGVGLARTNEFWASLLTGTAIGTTIEGAGACR